MRELFRSLSTKTSTADRPRPPSTTTPWWRPPVRPRRPCLCSGTTTSPPHPDIQARTTMWPRRRWFTVTSRRWRWPSTWLPSGAHPPWCLRRPVPEAAGPTSRRCRRDRRLLCSARNPGRSTIRRIIIIIIIINVIPVTLRSAAPKICLRRHRCHLVTRVSLFFFIIKHLLRKLVFDWKKVPLPTDYGFWCSFSCRMQWWRFQNNNSSRFWVIINFFYLWTAY